MTTRSTATGRTLRVISGSTPSRATLEQRWESAMEDGPGADDRWWRLQEAMLEVWAAITGAPEVIPPEPSDPAWHVTDELHELIKDRMLAAAGRPSVTPAA